MKTSLAAFLVFVLSLCGFGQGAASDFETLPVQKNIKDFPDRFDLSSPLSSGVSFNYLLLNGKDGRFGSASSRRIKFDLPDAGAADSAVSPKTRNFYLNTFVVEVITYKNEVACLISRYPESFYSLRFLSLENGRWLNAGEDMGMSLDEARKKFADRAEKLYGYLQRIKALSRVPTDPGAFADFLKKEGREPGPFMLRAFAEHPLVIYGEIHRRQWSWDFCRSVLRDKKFPETVGTIFLEISAHKQENLDRFFAKDAMDGELILDAFREIQNAGWPDRGMFEFLAEVWTLNRTLPREKRINVVAADIPRPFSRFKTAEEQEKYFAAAMDRNAFMAETVEKGLRARRDGRHAWFIVGTGHVYKSSVPGLASSTSPTDGLTAGALLSRRLPPGDVFTVFSHMAIIDNRGTIHGPIRNGVFDRVFNLHGDTPVAFRLDRGPFGRELFDALPEMSYQAAAGTFADNYDAYVFLGPLDREPNDYLLYELYSDDFVVEMSRRAIMEKSSLQKWFGVEKADRKTIIDKLRNDNERKKRWEK